MESTIKPHRIAGWIIIGALCSFFSGCVIVMLYLGRDGMVGLTWPEASVYLAIALVYLLVLTGFRYLSDIPPKPLFFMALYTSVKYGLIVFIINCTLKVNFLERYPHSGNNYPFQWCEQVRKDLLSFRSVFTVLLIAGFLFAFFVVCHLKEWFDLLIDKTVDFICRNEDPSKSLKK